MRKSNIELLRIIAMLLILVVHFDGASLGLPSADVIWTPNDWVKTIVEAISIIGVDLFILISGYFGIRTTRKKILSYLGMCAFYSVGIFIAVGIINPAKFTLTNVLDALLFVSHNDLWFVREYFFLMLLAPLINAGLEALNTHQRNILAASVVLLSCYFGWLWHGYDNPSGYTLLQMVTIYIVGSRLREYPIALLPASGLYLFATAGIIVCACFMPSTMAYAYNSPLVILAAVALFSIFASFDFKSSWVNSIAKYTFAVYLIHKNPYVWGGGLKPWVQKTYAAYSGFSFCLRIVLFTFGVFAACIIIEMVRRRISRFFTNRLFHTKREN